MRNDMLYTPPAAMDRLSRESERLQSTLRSAKKSDGSVDPEGLKKAAADFEALFVHHLIKTMQETVGDSGLYGQGFGSETYRDMIFHEIARKISQGGGLGLAKALLERLQNESSASDPASAPTSSALAAPPKLPPKTPSGPGVSPAAAPEGFRHEMKPAHLHAGEPFILPVRGRQTSDYGVRSHPISGARHFHKGVDLAAPTGTAVGAARQGHVRYSGYQDGYGNTVVVEHGDGYRTRYAHLQTLDVVVGDQVEQGQRRGRIGQTGRTTGPHLHFEVWRNGHSLNPHDLISAGV